MILLNARVILFILVVVLGVVIWAMLRVSRWRREVSKTLPAPSFGTSPEEESQIDEATRVDAGFTQTPPPEVAETTRMDASLTPPADYKVSRFRTGLLGRINPWSGQPRRWMGE